MFKVMGWTKMEKKLTKGPLKEFCSH